MVSLTGALALAMAFVPKLIGALLILLVGWIIARVVETLLVKGLRVVRFNQVADRAEIDQFLANAGVRTDPATVVGRLAYWFLMLIFVVAAFGAFGLPQVTDILDRIIGFIPNVVVAIVVLLLGALAANFVSNLVRGAAGTARIGDPNLLATLARSAIMVFAALMALDQLQVAPTIINTLWMALVGMVAVAGALAFGLGGRDLAHDLLQLWYERGREKTEDVRDAYRSSPASTRTAAGTPTASTTPSPRPATSSEERARRAA
jgi:hypothetical protein